MKKQLGKKNTTRHDPERAKHSLRAFRIGDGLPNLTTLMAELQDYTDVLLGREEPPVKVRGKTLALMECADAYYARAAEIKMLLYRYEREGRIVKGSPHYRFRTGELATFMEMAKRAADLGSRRLTEASMDEEAQRRGRESY